jgi:protein-disulfide isomerase
MIIMAEAHHHKKPKQMNIWKIISLALVVVLCISLFFLLGGGIAMATSIDPDEAATKATDFINDNLVQPGTSASIISVEESSGMYNVTLSYQGNDIPVYVTKDGNYVFLAAPVDLTQDLTVPEQTEQTEQPTEIIKADRPKVELFIWSYCPYGTQAQGPLAEVASLLGDSADFEAVLYYDGHGAHETQQNKIQGCIEEVAPDKYWEYAAGFIDSIYPTCGSSRDVECDKTESIDLMKSLGIDDSEVMSCVEESGDNLLASYASRASNYGVTGSPTLVINGVKVNTDRNAEAFKLAVCEAFNNPPEECSQVLSASSAAASGSC